MTYTKIRKADRYVNGTKYGLNEDYYNWSNSSPRDPSGKLILATNEHTMINSRLVADQQCPAVGPQFALQGCEVRPAFGVSASQRNEVRAKFMGRLKYGDADLGMTIATWRQSREMISSRTGKMFTFFTELGRKKRHLSKFNRKDWTKTRASDVLENNFGWVPLLGDIHAVMDTVFSHSIPDTWVSARAKHVFQEVQLSRDRTVGVDWYKNGHVNLTYAARVQISNPNLWMANRLGLINPLVVAWDAVPWSFVVNMFVNTNALISCLTDTVGLSLSQGSLTTTSHASLTTTQFEDWTQYISFNPYEGRWNTAARRNVAFTNVLCKQRTRVASGVPTPQLEFRLPNVNLGLAVTGMALVTQKVGGLVPNGLRRFT